jgi:hypothetical protein
MVVRSALTPAAFTSTKCSWYSFPLEAEPTPGPVCDRKDCVNKKCKFVVLSFKMVYVSQKCSISFRRYIHLTLHIYLQNIFLFSRMYVEDKKNGLRKVPILLLVTYFCGGELKEKSTGQNQKHLMNCNNITEILRLFPFIS